MLARDREMPRQFTRLNSHGVPWQPLAVAVILPAILVMLSEDLDKLADILRDRRGQRDHRSRIWGRVVSINASG